MTPSTRNVEIGKFIETEVISQLLRAGGAEGGTDLLDSGFPSG